MTATEGEPHRLMTTEEVADLARTTVATVRYWRQSGLGPPGFKVGRRVLYERREVMQWLLIQRERSERERQQVL